LNLLEFYSKQLDLIVLDQTELIKAKQKIFPYIFGSVLTPERYVEWNVFPAQVAVTVSSQVEHQLLYANNCGQRISFTLISERFHPGPGFRNEFYSPHTEYLRPESTHICFGCVSIQNLPDQNYDLLLQNKIFALNQICAQPGAFQGGVLLIEGIPSTSFLSWLIQRDVEEVPHCPCVEVVIMLSLPKPFHICPYLITIKPAKNFRWKKDNLNRMKQMLRCSSIFSEQFYAEHNLSAAAAAYNEAKQLIKKNLDWIPAHDVLIQVNKERVSNSDLSEIFWHVVKEKEGFSGLPRANFVIHKPEEIQCYVFAEIMRFITWIVDMANDEPDNVPCSVRTPLRKDTALKRLRVIDPICVDPSGLHHNFPDEEKISQIVKRFLSIFLKLRTINSVQTNQKIYHLPIAAIIGDFISGHLTEEFSHLRANNLTEVDGKMLENDFKSQVNYSYAQWISCLRYSVEDRCFQGSEHLAVRKRYETVEEVACEYEYAFFQMYAMVVYAMSPQDTEDTTHNREDVAHIHSISTLFDNILTFQRGFNVRRIWTRFYTQFKTSGARNATMRAIHKLTQTKLNKVAKDKKIDSISELNLYCGKLFTSFTLVALDLQSIRGFIQSIIARPRISEAEVEATYPQLLWLLNSLQPIGNVPQLKDVMLPILFENMHKEFLPVRSSDKILTLCFPPTQVTIHWVKYIYIVDPLGEVKISPETMSGKRKGMRISHSQLAGWGPVQAAGEIYFSRNSDGTWKCEQINNGSGHYEPDAEGSLLVAKAAILKALASTQIQMDPEGVAVRNVLLPGVPAHSFLKDTTV
jgi:hypothetical protein